MRDSINKGLILGLALIGYEDLDKLFTVSVFASVTWRCTMVFTWEIVTISYVCGLFVFKNK